MRSDDGPAEVAVVSVSVLLAVFGSNGGRWSMVAVFETWCRRRAALSTLTTSVKTARRAGGERRAVQ